MSVVSWLLAREMIVANLESHSVILDIFENGGTPLLLSIRKDSLYCNAIDTVIWTSSILLRPLKRNNIEWINTLVLRYDTSHIAT